MIHPFDISIFELDYIDIPNPGDGNNLSFPIPQTSRWNILSINILFRSSIQVAARTVQGGSKIGSILYNQFGSNQSQISSKNAHYRFAQNTGQFVFSSSRNIYWVPLPTPYFVDDRVALEINIIDIQAFDTIEDISLTVLKWKNPK